MSGYYVNKMNIRQTTFKIGKKENTLQTIITKKDNEFIARLILGESVIGDCKLIEMPGNCGIIVSTGLNVHEKYRRIGITSIFREQMYDILKNDMKISYVIGTVIDNNEIEMKSSEKAKFSTIDKFVNERTKHGIFIIGKKL